MPALLKPQLLHYPMGCRSPSRSPDGHIHSCHVPKFPTFEAVRGLPALSKRYRSMYVPSDFCQLRTLWPQSLGDGQTLDLTHHVALRISQVSLLDSDLAYATSEQLTDFKA